MQLKYAEIQLHRTEQLQAASVQSQDQLDNARTAADSLRAKIALAKNRWRVGRTDSRSTASSGQLHDSRAVRRDHRSKDAQVGEMVSPISAGGGFTRTGIATIVDMNSNEMEVDVTRRTSRAWNPANT